MLIIGSLAWESLQSPVNMVFLYISSLPPAFPRTISEPLSPHAQDHPLMEKSGLCLYWLFVLGQLPPRLGPHLFICIIEQGVGLAYELSAFYMSRHTHKILFQGFAPGLMEESS